MFDPKATNWNAGHRTSEKSTSAKARGRRRREQPASSTSPTRGAGRWSCSAQPNRRAAEDRRASPSRRSPRAARASPRRSTRAAKSGEAPPNTTSSTARCASACQAARKAATKRSARASTGQIAPDFEVARRERAAEGPPRRTRPTTSGRSPRTPTAKAKPGEERDLHDRKAPAVKLILPDDRGWELVSPPDKQGALIEPIEKPAWCRRRPAESAITYLANAPTEPQPPGYTNRVQVLSRRVARRGPRATSRYRTAPRRASPSARALSTSSSIPELDARRGAARSAPSTRALSAEASEQTAYPARARANPAARLLPAAGDGQGGLCQRGGRDGVRRRGAVRTPETHDQSKSAARNSSARAKT